MRVGGGPAVLGAWLTDVEGRSVNDLFALLEPNRTLADHTQPLNNS